MPRDRLPTATYRVQFNGGFTFDHAAALVPYLAELGISHCYASPYLRARSGSPHGYDIVDHNALNPEIGDDTAFRRFADTLQRHDMGQILDLVPNHMGVGGSDNAWWLDTLESGPAALCAAYFDIEWRPIKEVLRGRVLVPVLGGHYGSTLEAGDLKLLFDEERGELSVYYYNHRFPLDPGTYPQVLEAGMDTLNHQFAVDDPRLAEFKALCNAFRHLPARWETAADKMEERRRDKEVHKRRLAALCAEQPAIHAHLRHQVATLNGTPGEPASFERLHHLLEQQAYRLSFWQVAADEINYRRFFDINDLAGLRMEQPEVFAATHRLVLDLIAQGRLDGLRIDHPDGLYDPVGYYRQLQGEVRRVLAVPDDAPLPFYLVAEKILAPYEHLPDDWPVHGTTGYDFANLLGGLFVHPDAEEEMARIYGRFIGRRLEFDEVLYECKRLTIRVQLSSELTVLAAILDAIAQQDRHTRDFTLNGLRDALTTVVACFPVYRTYVRDGRVTDEDRRYVDWAIAQAKKRSLALDITIFDFIRGLLLLDGLEQRPAGYRAQVLRFAMKFQQYTAPVTAKALEDTSFYIYNRLVSLNEVGGDPRRFGVSVAAFHHGNLERAQRWPLALLTTCTHDTKRSADVRARISVLSELPGEWQRHLLRWARLNRARKGVVDDRPAPSANDEYLLYQTLLGAFPLEELDAQGLDAFRARIGAYMRKATKEAKVHTSWVNPNPAYEAATAQFIDALLAGPAAGNRFLTDFLPFMRRVARFGLQNALVQTALKLTVPGVADIYQGDELWDFSLVDPDNRRPVDWERRRALLRELKDAVADRPAPALLAELMEHPQDGRLKLFLTWRLLTLRRQFPDLFRHGDYRPLTCRGAREAHLCAFVRQREGLVLVVVAARWIARLCPDETPPIGEAVWQDTLVELPPELAGMALRDVLSRETVGCTREETPRLRVGDVLGWGPVGVLVGER